jgi:hypothetical protein
MCTTVLLRRRAGTVRVLLHLAWWHLLAAAHAATDCPARNFDLLAATWCLTRYGAAAALLAPHAGSKQEAAYATRPYLRLRLYGGGTPPADGSISGTDANTPNTARAKQDGANDGTPAAGDGTDHRLPVPKTRPGLGARHAAPLRVAPEPGDIIVGLAQTCHTSSLVEAVWDACFGDDASGGGTGAQAGMSASKGDGKRIYVRTGQQTWTGALMLCPGTKVSGFGFRVSGFGFRVSGLGFRATDMDRGLDAVCRHLNPNP